MGAIAAVDDMMEALTAMRSGIRFSSGRGLHVLQATLLLCHQPTHVM